MDTVGIYCRDCGALFYANARILADDVPDIIKYAKQGHEVRIVDATTVKLELASCLCREVPHAR